MKICAVQTKPKKGDIRANIENHKNLINQATAQGAALIIFPELSLTGYEPTLAKDLAIERHDARLNDFQKISDAKAITIGVGAPTKEENGICISMLLFQPHKPPNIYSKTYLHADEEPFFVCGQSSPLLQVRNTNIALAICYEISVEEHLRSALEVKPAIYFASVAKSVNGINRALAGLSTIARDHSIPVLMSNSVGFADGSQCAGHTSVWNNRGLLVGQLDDSQEGLLIFDTVRQEIFKRMNTPR